MATFPQARNGLNQPRYVSANNGQGICSKVTVDSSNRKINYFTTYLAYGASGYNNGSGTCGGLGRKVYGAIWLNKPSGVMTAPNYTSSNYHNTNEANALTYGNHTDFEFTKLMQFNFDNVVLDRNTVWMGIISDPFEKIIANPDKSSVVFTTARDTTSEDKWEGRFINYNTSPSYQWQNMWPGSSGYTGVLAFVSISTQSPYTQPSTYSVTPTTKINRVGWTFNYKYNISGGSGIIDWIDGKVYKNGTTWNYGKYNTGLDKTLPNSQLLHSDLSGNVGGTSKSGNGSFTLGADKFADGSSYPVAIVFSDSNWQWISGSDRLFYTYTKPTVNVTMNKRDFSPQEAPSFSWSYNNRKHGTDLEADFVRKVTLNGTTISGTSITMNDATINKYFNANARSVDTMFGKLYVENENISALSGTNRYVAFSEMSFNVQYKPTQKPTSASVTNQGSTILVDNVPTISMAWSYPHTTARAGVVHGYIIRVYADSSLSTQVGSNKTVTNSTVGAGGTITLNTATDLKRGVMNYATITPYYKKPNGTGIIEGSQYTKVTLVKPISTLNPPTIDYPVNNSNWHNKHFRVLFRLPVDDDLQSIINDSSIPEVTSASTYKYGDIEVKVTPVGGNTITYTMSSNSSAFSSTNIYHQRKMAIYPGAVSSLANASSYTISIRVKKKYYNLSSTDAWSKPVSITVNRTPVNKQSFEPGQIILDDHYDLVRNASVRLYNAYKGISSLHKDNVEQNRGDIINASEYNGIYNTLVSIKSGINGYCTYDRDITVDKNNTMVALNGTREFITAVDKDTTKGGRNYMNILVDEMNKLV